MSISWLTIKSYYSQFLGLPNRKYYTSSQDDSNTRKVTKLTQLKWGELQVATAVTATRESWDQEWWVAGHSTDNPCKKQNPILDYLELAYLKVLWCKLEALGTVKPVEYMTFFCLVVPGKLSAVMFEPH